MSQDVTLDRVTMQFGAFTAVNDVSLDINAGEFFSLLGPSGCGKTTILRLISGFMAPSRGAVRIGGVDMMTIGANRRPTALIFQHLALFPLMPVWENIAFGLEVRGASKKQRRMRAEELLDLVAMPNAGDKRIHELSGGQKQRIAIARALAVEPKVMLLDEPLSALDLKMRQHMRAELRAIQRRTGVTFIYITHDQGEALTMSDRVAVMSGGTVQQIGRPTDIYNDPRTAFVASFVGESNRFRGRIAGVSGNEAMLETAGGALLARNPLGLATGTEAELFVRPERMIFDAKGGLPNSLSCHINHVDFEGNVANIFLRDGFQREIMVQLANIGSLPDVTAGRAVTVAFQPIDGAILPIETPR